MTFPNRSPGFPAFASQSSFPSDGGGLLGRLGGELALVYHDTLQSPLPPVLRELIDRLDASLAGVSSSTRPDTGD